MSDLPHKRRPAEDSTPSVKKRVGAGLPDIPKDDREAAGHKMLKLEFWYGPGLSFGIGFGLGCGLSLYLGAGLATALIWGLGLGLLLAICLVAMGAA